MKHTLEEVQPAVPTAERASVVPLPTDEPVWSSVFLVSPLVLVGTLEADGRVDLAPKHMAMPLGWQNRFCFVCSRRHATLRNAEARGAFTVSFPRPDHVLDVSLAAGGRAEDDSKPSLAALRTFPATRVEGPLVEGCYLYLECQLERIVEGFGENALVVGEVVAASAAEEALRLSDGDDADTIARVPLLAYLSPGRFAVVERSLSFPFPIDFRT
ncbi:MAG: flavin reductase [Thermoleophilia bacterium]|nr:flavin reductase [Gaiellaceae bacterium]MDW8338228.1 flavin reductase [Thermoleophilia bacterium]